MDRQIEEFLKSSPMAEKIRLQGKIVIHRAKLTPGKIAAIKNQGQYEIPEQERICEFKVGETFLASGKIIEKEGEYYFQPEGVDKEEKK